MWRPLEDEDEIDADAEADAECDSKGKRLLAALCAKGRDPIFADAGAGGGWSPAMDGCVERVSAAGIGSGVALRLVWREDV